MDGLKTFLVERYTSKADGRSMDLVARLESAGRALAIEGIHVEWLWSVVLVNEDSSLCLFRARSEDDVAQLNERANAAYDRLVEAVALLPPGGSHGPTVHALPLGDLSAIT